MVGVGVPSGGGQRVSRESPIAQVGASSLPVVEGLTGQDELAADGASSCSTALGAAAIMVGGLEGRRIPA